MGEKVHDLPQFIDPDSTEGTRSVKAWRCSVDKGIWLTQTCGFGGRHWPVTIVMTTEIKDGHDA